MFSVVSCGFAREDRTLGVPSAAAVDEFLFELLSRRGTFSGEEWSLGVRTGRLLYLDSLRISVELVVLRVFQGGMVVLSCAFWHITDRTVMMFTGQLLMLRSNAVLCVVVLFINDLVRPSALASSRSSTFPGAFGPP